jgi:hypothetical protein
MALLGGVRHDMAGVGIGTGRKADRRDFFNNKKIKIKK